MNMSCSFTPAHHSIVLFQPQVPLNSPFKLISAIWIFAKLEHVDCSCKRPSGYLIYLLQGMGVCFVFSNTEKY